MLFDRRRLEPFKASAYRKPLTTPNIDPLLDIRPIGWPNDQQQPFRKAAEIQVRPRTYVVRTRVRIKPDAVEAVLVENQSPQAVAGTAIDYAAAVLAYPIEYLHSR